MDMHIFLINNISVHIHAAHRILLLLRNHYSGGDQTMISYGHIDQFHHENESIEAYLKRVDKYFEISDEKKELI